MAPFDPVVSLDDELKCIITEKDAFNDWMKNVPFGYKGFGAGDGNDMEIPTMFSQRLNMSPNKFVASASSGLADLKELGCKRDTAGGHSTITAFLDVPDELKFDYCTVILCENP
ncbi:RING-H2 finger protein ATL66 [Cucumis melo var. makuwa]|uniref:RING-H2 finger protein ATL66 n=1 Tax=Cucumis melo var. makuwa TaxID=1194695 RepID=A0A5D3BUD7_CUCMM|nr:RING-H2 finger protein ATL66 [Cucumis melo var. makuwa]TYK02598.1 RING-H2 finger protein ATL66 [Cucumis melo var. makuwa]